MSVNTSSSSFMWVFVSSSDFCIRCAGFLSDAFVSKRNEKKRKQSALLAEAEVGGCSFPKDEDGHPAPIPSNKIRFCLSFCLSF